MDESMKNLTSKAPIKPSEIPSLPSTSDFNQRIKEINENDQDLHHHQMGSKLQNSKKPSMAKNFMSPTVSASSKATTPRKKILGERNEASSGTIFSDTHLQKRSTHASADLISSPITKLPPKVSEMEDTGIDSISQPYDPLTNFLSLRPKFLRYNPNRRLEILLRREGEMKEEQENELTDTLAKNFMSPTVSASSKATTPRNEASSGTIFSDTHNASADLISSPITKLPPKVSEMEDTGIDSISQPYDPLTNFLSLRPKFLRYNPNRRLEILLRREGQMKEEQENELTDTSSDSEEVVEEEVPSDGDGDGDGDGDASSSSSEEGSKKPEEEEETHEPKKPEDESSGLKELGVNPPPPPPPPSKEEETHENGDEKDEEIEEVEEEEEEKGKHGYLNQAMKFLLLLLVLTLSTLYVSSLNSPTPPPTLQALRDYKVEYLKIQKSFVVWGTTFLDQMEEYNQNLLMEAIERKNEERVTEEEMVTKEEMVEEEWEEEKVSDQVDEEMLEMGEGEKVQSVKEEEGIQKEEMIVEELEGKSVELSDQMDELTEVILDEEVSEKAVILDEEVLEAESTSLNEEEEEMVADELEKTGDVTDESHDSSMVEDELEKTGAATDESHDSSMVEDELEKTGDATDESHDSSMVEDELEKSGDATDESHDSMEKTSVISQTLEDLPQTQNSIGADTPPSITEPEVTSSQKEVEDTEEPMEIELTEKWVIGITVISVIFAYIVVNFLRIIRRRKPSAKDSSVTFKKPSFEYAAKEKNGGTTQMLLKKEEINAERIVEKAAESYVKPCSSIFSGVQDYKEIYRIQAPTVELLGEYVVEELNSSFKSCSLKPKKTVECEESIFSVSLDQKPRRMAFSSPVHHEQPSLSEFSAINSPSNGSFTPREKSGRKKEAKDGKEAFQMATTPFRRSSRLRSKSVTSP